MGECKSNATINYLGRVKVAITSTCPHIPEQKMTIELLWRTIDESAIAMLLTASLSQISWQEARTTACYLYNRSPGAHVEVNPVSPYEQYYAKGNHDPKAQIGVFVEYQDKQTVLTHYERVSRWL
jgi:hypothetical protein